MSGTKKIEINARGPILCLLFLKDGRYLLSGGHESMIRQWRSDDGAEVGEAMKTGSTITSMALSNDGKWLVSGGERVANVWSMKSRQIVLTVCEHSQLVDTVHVSPDSTKFATGSNDKKVFIWDIASGERLVGPLEHDSRLGAVRFSPKSDRIATATNGMLRIYDTHHGELLRIIPVSANSYPSNLISWSGNQTIFALVSQSTLMHIDVNTGQSFSSWKIPGDPVHCFDSYALGCIVPSSNGRFIASSLGHVVSLWDTSTSAQISSEIRNPKHVRSLALSPQGNYLAIGDTETKIVVHNLEGLVSDYYLIGERAEKPPQDRNLENLGSQIEVLCGELRALESRVDGINGTIMESKNLLRVPSDVPLRIPHGTFRIKCSAGNLYLTYLRGKAGMVVAQQLDELNVSQRWTVTPVANGAYDIAGRTGNLILPLNVGSDDTLLCSCDVYTTWTIEPRGSAYVIGNAENATAIHVHLQAGECNEVASQSMIYRASASLRDNSVNQRWVLEHVME